MRYSAYLLLLGAVSISSGCWVAQNATSSGQYAREVSLATLRVAQLEVALTESEARLAQLEDFARLQGENEDSRVENFDDLNRALTELRGTIEEIQFALRQIESDSEERTLENESRLLYSEQRLTAIEGYLSINPPPMPTVEVVDDDGVLAADALAVPEEKTPLVEDEKPLTIQEKLESATAHMMEQRHGVARALLQKMVEDNPGHSLLGEVHYRLAETYYNEDRWGAAARAFQLVVTNYSQQDWASWAMLRQGECFDAMEQPDSGMLFYEDLVVKYPKSDAAKEARSKIKGK